MGRLVEALEPASRAAGGAPVDGHRSVTAPVVRSLASGSVVWEGSPAVATLRALGTPDRASAQPSDFTGGKAMRSGVGGISGARRAIAAVCAVLACVTVGAAGAQAAAPVLTPVAGSPFDVGGLAGPVSFSPSGQLLASANDIDGTVSMMTVGPGGALSPVPGSPFEADEPLDVTFSPSGGLLAIPEPEASSVAMLSVAGDGSLTRIEPTFSTGTGTQPLNVAFGPSGGLLAAADGVDAVSLFSVAANGVLTLLPGSPVTTDGPAVDVKFSPSGSLLAVSEDVPDGGGGSTGEVSVYEVGAGGQLTAEPGSPFAMADAPGSLSFSPDGRLLATSTLNPAVVSTFWVGSDGRLTQTAASPLPVGSNLGPLDVAFSPAGGLLAVPGGATFDIPAENDVAMYTVDEPATGFIENTAPPKLYGDAVVGHRLLASNGRWKTSSTTTYSFTWELCTAADDAGCTPLTGGVGRLSPKLTSADAGGYLLPPDKSVGSVSGAD
jgi:6-phosphogluconolactonase (cycloisomerase 2 family)